MEISKYKIDSWCILKMGNNYYDKSLSYIHLLMQAARDDFPELRDADIYIKVFSKDWKGQIGIEFPAPNETPKEYSGVLYPLLSNFQ